MRKIYIAGKITGQEEQARIQFAEAKHILSLRFPEAEIINPMNLPHNHDKSWESYMKECIANLMQCDTIYLLEGFHKSKGASIEYNLARKFHYTIKYQSEISNQQS
jgi:hypothetical protein